VNLAIERLLSVARHEIGVAEHPKGSNNVKYNTAFYGHPIHRKAGDDPRVGAWCVVFQWWCFQRAGIPTSIFPASANVFRTRDWFKKHHQFAHTPHVGSLVIFEKSHIGLVEKVLKNGRIQTIEGNTDSSGSPTGGQVMRVTHGRNDGIQGFCNPDYRRAVRILTKHGAPPLPQQARASMRAGGMAAKTAPRPTASPAIVLPARTVVHADNVHLPAGRTKYVQFGSASVNTGRFWREPVGTRRGYNLVVGPGAYLADVTVAAPEPSDNNEIEFRLVQADPAGGFHVVRRLPAGRIGVDSAGSGHSTTLSSLGPGHHVWLAMRSEQEVVLPSVSVELVLLSR
jgi:hypothetical protein